MVILLTFAPRYCYTINSMKVRNFGFFRKGLGKMVKSKQRAISIVLAVLIAFSTLFAGTASAFAVDTTDVDSGAAVQIVPSELPSRIYMKLNSDWGIDNPRFAAYFFVDGNTNTWVDMTAVSGETDMYSCAVPSGGNWTHVIFCRMNPDTSDNNWNNKWNQTADIPLDSNNNLCTLNGGWDSISGTWSTYAGEEEVTDPTTAPTNPTSAPTTPTSAPTDPIVSDKLTVNGQNYNVGDTIEYTTTLRNAARLSAIGGHVSLSGDTSKLSLQTTSESEACPNLTGQVVVNFEPNDGSNAIYFSAISESTGIDFSSTKDLITLEFVVTQAGGNVNISTVIDEIYDLNKNTVTSAVTTTSTVLSGSAPSTGVLINGTRFYQGDVIEYVGYLNCSDRLYALVGNTIYDSNYVRLDDVQLDQSEMFPVIYTGGNFTYDLNSVANQVGYNAICTPSAGGYDFTGSNAVLARIRFVVTASSGSTSIRTNISEAYSMTDIDSDGVPNPVVPSVRDSVALYGSETTDPTDGYVYVNGERAQKGDTVVFTVKAQYDRELQVASADMEWDPAYLELVPQDDSVCFPILSQSSFFSNYDAPASASYLNRCSYGLVDALHPADLTDPDSVYATFTFTVVADSGRTSITHEFTDAADSVYDEMLDPISYECITTVTPLDGDYVYVNGEKAQKGDTVVFTVKAQYDRELQVASADMEWDPAYLELVPQDDSVCFPILSQSSFFSNYDAPASASYLNRCSYGLVDALHPADLTDPDSVYATFTFTVVADSGRTSITHEFTDAADSVYDEMLEPISYECITTVNPSGEEPSEPTDPTDRGSVIINGTEFNTGDIIEYVLYLNADEYLSAVQFDTFYDNDYVTFSSDQLADDEMFPNFANPLSTKYEVHDTQIRTSSMANLSNNVPGYDFTADDTVIAIFRFEVTATSGSTSIYSVFDSVLSNETYVDDVPMPVDYTSWDIVRLYKAAPTEPQQPALTINGEQAEQGDQIVFKGYLDADDTLTDISSIVTYPADLLEVSQLTISAGMGIYGDGTWVSDGSINFTSTDGAIDLSFINDNGVDFTSEELFVTLVFNVIADEGNGTIDIDYDSVSTSASDRVEVEVLPDEAMNDYYMGDINGDNRITVADAIEVQKAIAGLVSEDSITGNADVDFNGRVTVADAIAIQKFIANISGFMYPTIYR